jgi:hypothetical protein
MLKMFGLTRGLRIEQTFYLPIENMKSPEESPLHILEQLTGKSLVP